MRSTTSDLKPVGQPAAASAPQAARAARPRQVQLRVLIALIAITSAVSLLYAIQYYAGSPIRIPVTNPIEDIAIVPGGTILAAARADGQVQVWDAGQNWTKRTLTGHSGPVTELAFVRGSYTLYTAGQDGTLRRWNAARGAAGPVIESDGQPLIGLSLSTDGSRAVTLSEDGVVRIWDLAAGQALQTIAAGAEPREAVALSADGSLVAAGEGANIQLWDASSGQQLRLLEGRWEDEETKETWLGHRRPVTALAFSPDGALLAAGAADATFAFWNVEEGTVQWQNDGHYGAINDIVFNSEGNLVVTAAQDTKARTWRLPGGKIVATYEGHLSAATGAAFGPDNTLLTVSDDGTLRQWDTRNQKVVHIEWTRYGILPIWGRTLTVWFLVSGVVGLVVAWGLRRDFIWSHLLALALFLIGPIIVLGLPVFEVTRFPAPTSVRLQVVAPLLALAVLYVVILVLLTREAVASRFEAPEDVSLAERLMTGRRTAVIRLGIFGAAVWIAVLVILYSLLRRFNLDVAFMGHFFSFIMAGAGTTLYVSALSIILAIFMALLGALGRLSKNPIANGVSSFYISLIRGTPLLVQVYIWYLGLPRVGVVLPAIVGGILALGVNYGAYMTETFRAGIQAIGKGQHEAAHALGMTGGQTFRRIVLPQAFRIVIPPIGNDFIAMLKDSSLVSIITVWELSFRAQKIGRQYFRALETFLIAAAFYWILTVLFQFLQGKLETYLARSERK